jgi:hypothetical protein
VNARFIVLGLATSVAFGCSTLWGFEDLGSDNAGTGGSGANPGATGGRGPSGPGGTGATGGAKGTGGAVAACQQSCLAGCEACDSGCTDLLTDPVNCGRCETRCIGSRTCQDGKCACPAGFDLCPGDDLVDACFDLLVDVKHCGDCETNCGTDGLCVDGTCEFPKELASEQGNPAAIAVDDTYVYYATGSEIRRVPSEGGLVETLGAPGATRKLVLYGDSLYYADDSGSILRLSIEGGDPVEVVSVYPVVAEGPRVPIAVHDDFVYFVESQTVARVSIDGGERTAVASGMVADQQQGIFVNADGIYTAWSLGFYRHPLTGGSYELVGRRNTSEKAEVRNLVVAPGDPEDVLFFTVGGGGTLRREPLFSMYSGASVTSDAVAKIVLDEAGGEVVYIGGNGIQSISTAPGATPRRISRDHGSDLAVTPEYVYWTKPATSASTMDGSVQRAAR